MIRKLILAALAAVALAGTACKAGPRERAFTEGVEALAVDSGLLKEYEGYVEKDPAIKEETKKLRKETSAKLKQLIDDQKRAIED